MSGILEWFLENENGWQPIRQLDYFGWLQATVYVYEDNYEIQGFIGMNSEYIEGIFVSEAMQSQGIGKILLNKDIADYIDKKIHF